MEITRKVNNNSKRFLGQGEFALFGWGGGLTAILWTNAFVDIWAFLKRKLGCTNMSPSRCAKGGHTTGRPNGITDRELFLELIMHFITDTDTDENDFELIFRSRYRHSCCL